MSRNIPGVGVALEPARWQTVLVLPSWLRGGYLTIARLRGTPIRIHFSAPIAALFFSRFQIAPWYWAGFFALVLWHELGHALVVWGVRARVLAVDVHGAGGQCAWQGSVSPVGRAFIAWGGVLAQAALYVLTAATVGMVGAPGHGGTADLVEVFTEANLWIIGLNLLPIPGLDGAEAWKLIPLLIRRSRERRAQTTGRREAKKRVAAQEEIDRIDDADAVARRETDALLARVFERVAREAREARTGRKDPQDK